MTRRHTRFRVRATLGIAAISLLAACGALTSSAAPSIPTAASPGEAFGAFPGVEGFGYRPATGHVPGFLAGMQATLGDQVEIEIGQAAAATRGEEEVALIAFSFPGSDDAQAVDFFARVLDDMEDGFQAGAQRGLGGEAYVMTGNGQTAVLTPWARVEEDLVFLFIAGPEGITEEFAVEILEAQD
jgi:hypothetical protein